MMVRLRTKPTRCQPIFSLMNRKMAPELESVYLMAKADFLYLSASRLREVSRLGYDVADLVPPNVRLAIREKLAHA